MKAVRAARSGEGNKAARKRLYQSLRESLWHGRVDEALSTLIGLRAAEQLKPLEAAISYVHNQRAWIGDYEAWQQQEYPVGSGLVERQVELVINRRLKGQGMRWLREHADAVAALRVRELNTDWDDDEDGELAA